MATYQELVFTADALRNNIDGDVEFIYTGSEIVADGEVLVLDQHHAINVHDDRVQVYVKLKEA